MAEPTDAEKLVAAELAKTTKKKLDVETMNALITKAEEATTKLDEGNKVLGELLVRQEALKLEATLAGQADAGHKPKELTEEEKAIESANKFLEGTGYEDLLKPATPTDSK